MIEYEYSYTKTLHLTFDERVGIGSYGLTEEEFPGFIPKPDKTLQEYETITERIEIIIESVLGDEVKIDWINTCEVDINNIPIGDTNRFQLIKKLENYINHAFQK